MTNPLASQQPAPIPGLFGHTAKCDCTVCVYTRACRAKLALSTPLGTPGKGEKQ